MSFYISIIGIDGSGKSTVLPALANLVAAELGLTAIAAGDDCWGKSAQEDLFRPGFAPQGERVTARLGRLFRRGARATTGRRKLYPLLKLAQLALQERTIRGLATAYQPDVIFSDGNLLLSSGGRAINYFTPQAGPAARPAQCSPYRAIEVLYNYVFTGQPLPRHILCALPTLRLMRWLHRFDQLFKLDLLRLPDAVIFLEVTPEAALARLQARGKPLDAHENLHDLTQAQAMYQGVVNFFQHRRGEGRTAVIDTTELALGETLAQIVDFVQRLLPHKEVSRKTEGHLGRSEERLIEPPTILKKVLNYRYLARYLLPHLRQGSVYELAFPLSKLGRMFLKEGYSAGVMQAIYLQDCRPANFLDTLFLNYPLHQAAYHRRQILDQAIEAELRQRLALLPAGETIKVLTVPSGYALDLFQPLQRLSRPAWAETRPLQIVASDLDPQGAIEGELLQAAQQVKVGFEFIRGDLTSPEIRERFQQAGPYDLILFIGLSSWLAKRPLVNHLKLVRHSLLAPGGVLITDCFTPQAFALSGKYMGYKANYYDPDEFTSLLAYCGFDPALLTWQSGTARINHVCVARTVFNPKEESSRHETRKLDPHPLVPNQQHSAQRPDRLPQRLFEGLLD